jgi:hypothetical protein
MTKHKNILIFILLAAAAGLVFYYTRKKKAATPYVPNSPANIGETSKALQVSPEDAGIIDERRTAVTETATANPDFKPVATVAETLSCNGKTHPILGYSREGSRNQTHVLVPVESVPDFATFNGGVLSRSISAQVTINTGKYAGTWNAWYIYTNSAWESRRANIYIDAPWKG